MRCGSAYRKDGAILGDAADGLATQEELRLLELLRHRLDVGRLEAAAIERGARARHMPAM